MSSSETSPPRPRIDSSNCKHAASRHPRVDSTTPNVANSPPPQTASPSFRSAPNSWASQAPASNFRTLYRLDQPRNCLVPLPPPRWRNCSASSPALSPRLAPSTPRTGHDTSPLRQHRLSLVCGSNCTTPGQAPRQFRAPFPGRHSLSLMPQTLLGLIQIKYAASAYLCASRKGLPTGTLHPPDPHRARVD